MGTCICMAESLCCSPETVTTLLVHQLGCAMLSSIWLFTTPWTIDRQAPLSMEILQARILEWVAMSSSKESPQTSNWTHVSCIAGRFSTSWAMREAPFTLYLLKFLYHKFSYQSSLQISNLDIYRRNAISKFATLQKMFIEWNLMRLNHKMACSHFVTR